MANAKFRRQATLGPYVVDFVCVEAGLVIEADGGQHSSDKDAVRTAWLEGRGVRLLRFWNNEITDNLEGVLTTIISALEAKEEPSPNPLPPAGEG